MALLHEGAELTEVSLARRTWPHTVVADGLVTKATATLGGCLPLAALTAGRRQTW